MRRGPMAVLALAAVGTVAFLTTRLGDSPAPPQGAAVSPPWQLFEPGRAYRYRLSWSSSERVTPVAAPGMNAQAAPGIKGTLDLTGMLEVRAYPSDGRVPRLGLVLSELERAELSINGSAVPGLDEVLAGRELGLDVAPSGSFRRYLAPAEMDPLAVQTLRGLAMRMQVSGPPSVAEDRWRSMETVPHGVVASEHTRDGSVVDRSRARYASLDVARVAGLAPEITLDARARVSLHDDGTLRALDDFEALRATSDGEVLLDGTHTLTLTLEGSRALDDVTDMTTWRARPLAEVPTSDQLAERALAQQADGMTPADVIKLLTRHMNEGRLPDHNKTLWRMAAVLELHPDLARALLELFKEDAATSKARALLLDLLASVGHAEAQAAMREALQSDVGREDPTHGLLYQRLGLVDAPDAETIELARAQLEDAQRSGDVEQAMLKAYTAGAVAGHAATESAAARDSIAEELGGMLSAATTATEQKHLVKALGNAKRPEDQVQIATLAASEDSGVRQSVARALSEPATDVGLAALLVLAAGTDPYAQSEAIRALRHHELAAEHYGTLAEIVASGGLHKRNHRTLLDLVKYDRARLPDATTHLLEAMLTLDLEAAVRGAVTALLEG